MLIAICLGDGIPKNASHWLEKMVNHCARMIKKMIFLISRSPLV